MKQNIIFILLFLVSCNYKQNKPVYSETESIVKDKEPASKTIQKFDESFFECDSELTTVGINICSETKAIFVDSLLNDLYGQILFSIDMEIEEEHTTLEKSKRIINKESEENIKRCYKEIERYERLKIAIQNSQNGWIRQREFNIEIYKITCEGGTACNAIVNDAVMKETLDRIRLLETIYDL